MDAQPNTALAAVQPCGDLQQPITQTGQFLLTNRHFVYPHTDTPTDSRRTRARIDMLALTEEVRHENYLLFLP